jgi:hypothetical protein
MMIWRHILQFLQCLSFYTLVAGNARFFFQEIRKILKHPAIKTEILHKGGIMLLKNRNSIVLLLSLFVATGLSAQNLGASRFSGSVNSAGSDSFVVANNGRQQTYQTGAIPANGLALQNSDMIQTGPSNYVEVQLDPSEAIVKLAENTSVVFNDLGSANRSALLSFLYGRMRIVNPGNNGTVTIQVGNAAIEFSRGDLALDFAVIPGSSNKQPQLQVSTLSGTAQVVSSAASPGAPRTPLYENETVTFDVTTRLAVITRQPLNQEIAAYWSRNGFRQAGLSPHSTYLAQGGQSALPAIGAYPAGTNPSSLGGPAQPNYSSGSSAGQKSREATAADSIRTADVDLMSNENATITVKNGGVFWGAIITAVGVLGQSVSHYNMFGLNESANDKLFAFSYAPIAAGLITLVATYIYLYRHSN